MEFVAKKLASILSIFYFDKLWKALSYFGRLVYSSIQKKKLRKAGKEFYVNPPFYVKGAKYISVGENFACGRRVRIEAWDSYHDERFSPFIEIKENVTIGNDCHIAAINGITIERGVLLGSKILITDHFHGNNSWDDLKVSPLHRKLYSKGKIVIGENVWIGENAAIMPGVKIGKNAIIGANTVVTKDIPENAVAVGAPARVSKIIKKQG